MWRHVNNVKHGRLWHDMETAGWSFIMEKDKWKLKPIYVTYYKLKLRQEKATACN